MSPPLLLSTPHMRNIPAMKLSKKPTMAVPLFMTNLLTIFFLFETSVGALAGSGAMPGEEPIPGGFVAGVSSPTEAGAPADPRAPARQGRVPELVSAWADGTRREPLQGGRAPPRVRRRVARDGELSAP